MRSRNSCVVTVCFGVGKRQPCGVFRSFFSRIAQGVVLGVICGTLMDKNKARQRRQRQGERIWPSMGLNVDGLNATVVANIGPTIFF